MQKLPYKKTNKKTERKQSLLFISEKKKKNCLPFENEKRNTFNLRNTSIFFKGRFSLIIQSFTLSSNLIIPSWIIESFMLYWEFQSHKIVSYFANGTSNQLYVQGFFFLLIKGKKVESRKKRRDFLPWGVDIGIGYQTTIKSCLLFLLSDFFIF